MILRSRLIGRVEISPSAMSTLTCYRQRPRAAERGGVLAGYRIGARSWVVTHASPPSPRSLAGLFWVKRDRRDAQCFIDRVFAETNGTVNYLGEWHTHPEPYPSTSREDRTMLVELLRNSRLEIDFLLGAIVGTAGAQYWWCQTASGELESLSVGGLERRPRDGLLRSKARSS